MELEASDIGGVCDIDRDRVSKIGKRLKGIKIEVDYKRLLKDPKIDAVVVATPPKTHYRIIKDALLEGKDVLAEKPLTLLPSESEELVDLSIKSERILMVAHTFLYNAAIKRMKNYIENGDLGRIYYLQAIRTHLGLIREDVNAAWDLATHDVSIFSYLLGDQPKEVSAKGGYYLREGRCDAAFITLSYPDGVIGSIIASWIDTNKVRQIALIGSKARLLFDDLNNLEKLRVYEKGVSVERPISGFGEFQYLLRDGDIISPKIELEEPLKVQCRHFLECIGSRKRPITDGVDGLRVVRVMAAVDESLKKDGMPVKVWKG
jgi:predicted dehydrogenase